MSGKSNPIKPADCTCPYPAAMARNPSGHGPDCPVYKTYWSEVERSKTVNAEWKTKARITNPERLALWQAVFGGDEVPIVSIVPQVGNFPGVGEQRFYSLDLKAITPEQRQRLVASIAAKFGQTVEFVEANIETIGVPILACDVVVSSSDFRQIANVVW